MGNPITNLGCPLYIGRQRIIYYSHLVEKASKKVCGWQERLLSFGSKITMIKHAFQSIPIHTMAAVSPPNTIIKYIVYHSRLFLGKRLGQEKVSLGIS
ncbi:hypothetical protein RDI58_013424 [Solanum bulbocastanum]|uniref:Uncharacterized protein n=1 Tax=Solanum bulbocastanum TaxID=147425 RepID=A0AAN8YDZ7_SOLBU